VNVEYSVVGFTGTKDGLTPPQLTALETLLAAIPGARTLHHGDCVGADDAAHHLARRFGWRIVVHPPINQARACGHIGDLRLPPKDFLARNADIVAAAAEAAGLLVACPGQAEERLRSGTWATVRRGRRARIPVGLVLPDGSTRWERPDLFGAVAS
jgi:hypothetical protein